MKLAELAKLTPWQEVAVALARLFPGRKEQLSAYRGLFEELGTIVPSPQAMRISVEEEFLPPKQLAILQVVGRDGTLQRDLPGWPDLYDEHEGSDAGASEATFTLWNYPRDKWLGMEVEPMTLRCFTRGEIFARILVEMTRLGFTDAARKAVVDAIQLQAHKSNMGESTRHH